MAIKLFKSGSLIKTDDGTRIILFNPSTAIYRVVGGEYLLLDNVKKTNVNLGPFTNITDENDVPYTDDQAVLDFLDNAFGAPVSIFDNEGAIGVQNPLSVDGDSIYAQDIDFANSDFTDWVGDQEDLFQSPFNIFKCRV
jgi:hypothetical protein